MQSNHALCVVRTTNTVKEDHAGLLKLTATYAAQDKYVGPKPLVWIHARSTLCTVKNEVIQSVRVSMHSATLAMSVKVTTVH